MNFKFMYPDYLFLLFLLVPVYWLAVRTRFPFGHSSLKPHKNLKFFTFLASLLRVVLILGLASSVIALARPQLPITHKTKILDTKDVIIAADVSGSMGQSFIIPGLPVADQTEMGAGVYAIDEMANQLTDARLGLIACDTSGLYNLWPISSDHKVLDERAQWLNTYINAGNGSGDNMDGPNPSLGEAPTGCVQASADMFNAMHDASVHSRVVVIVSNGDPEMGNKRTAYLVSEYAKMHIKVILLATDQNFTSDGNSTGDVVKFVNGTHGTIIQLTDRNSIQAAIDIVKNMVASKLVLKEQVVGYRNIAGYFIGLSLIFMILYLTGVAAIKSDM